MHSGMEPKGNLKWHEPSTTSLSVAVQTNEMGFIVFLFFTVDLRYHLKFVAHVKTCVPVTEPTKTQGSAKEWFVEIANTGCLCHSNEKVE